MTKAQVVDRFLDGIVGKASSASTDGELLKSYDVVVARRITDGDHVEVLVTTTYYSATTSKLLTQVEKACNKKPDTECVKVSDVMGPLVGRCMDCLFVHCVCDQYEDDPTEPDPTEPEEDDLTTEDYKKWYQEGRLVVLVEGDPHSKTSDMQSDFNSELWQRQLMDYMNRSNYWPNVWFQGERGDWNLLSIGTGSYIKFKK